LDDTSGSTPFSSALLDLLVRQIQRIADNATASAASHAAVMPQPATLVPGKRLLPGTTRSSTACLGLVASQCALGLRHTLSAWVRRDRVPADDRQGTLTLTALLQYDAVLRSRLLAVAQ
jgi:hypothetical protein